MICSVVKYKPTSPPQGTHIGIKNRTREWVREWERERKREREKKRDREQEIYRGNWRNTFLPCGYTVVKITFISAMDNINDWAVLFRSWFIKTW